MPNNPGPLPPKMKAWLLEEFNKPYVPREIPIPKLEDPNDILVKVEACSYCHTDAVVAAGTVTRPPLPHVGCHEFAGTVHALPPGSGISLHGLQVGDRVAVSGRGNHVCGACRECRADSAPLPDAEGYSVFCPLSGAGLGVDRPGGFREFAVVDARQVGRVPEGLDFVEVAPLMCAGLTIYSALLKLTVPENPGVRLGIVGCGGGLGHLGIQFAGAMGARVVGFDAKPEALRLARRLAGARGSNVEIVDVSDGEASQPRLLRQRMGEEDGYTVYNQMGLDAVVVLTDAQGPFDFACEMLRDGGKLMLLSFPPEGLHFSAFDIVIRRISIEGSLIGSNRAMRDMFEFCLEHDVRAEVTRYSFERLNELVGDYHGGGVPGKLVLDLGME